MARAADYPGRVLFSTSSYISSWWTNNAYYAGTAGKTYAFVAGDGYTTSVGGGYRGSRSALYSGVVHPAGYSAISPRGYGGTPSNPYWGTPRTMFNTSSPIRNAYQPYDAFGNIRRQRGDIQLGKLMMGGYQFPGQAFSPDYSPQKGLRANTLVRWFENLGMGGYTDPMVRFRRSDKSWRSTGWAGNLTTATSANKALEVPGANGRGQSSEDSTTEMYKTIETTLGARSSFTDETWNEAKSKFAQSWAGWKELGDTGKQPYLDASLGQMFEEENTNVGFARRVQRSGF